MKTTWKKSRITAVIILYFLFAFSIASVLAVPLSWVKKLGDQVLGDPSVSQTSFLLGLSIQGSQKVALGACSNYKRQASAPTSGPHLAVVPFGAAKCSQYLSYKPWFAFHRKEETKCRVLAVQLDKWEVRNYKQPFSCHRK